MKLNNLLKIELRYKPHSWINKEDDKIWWFNKYNNNPNKLVYHYIGKKGAHNNVTLTEYVDIPVEFNKNNSKLELINEDNKWYVLLIKNEIL